jgi:hypothetical protein
MSTHDLIGWLAYLELDEEREQRRLVDALSLAMMQLFGKE